MLAGDAERARQALTGLWRLELERLLARHPEAAGELTELAAGIRTAFRSGDTGTGTEKTAG